MASEPVPINVYKPFGILRFLLALFVAEAHAYTLAGIEGPINPIQQSLGTIAVTIFFIISGYVITEAVNMFYRDRAGDFLLNRFLRLFPPYCVALAVAIGLHYLLYLGGLMPDEITGTRVATRGGDEAVVLAVSVPVHDIFSVHNLASNLLVMPMIYGIGMIGMFPSYPFVPPYWALNVEIQYYLIAAFIGWGAYRFAPSLYGKRETNGSSSGHDVFVPRMAMVLVSVTVCLCGILYWGAVGWGVQGFRYFRYAPYFLVGACLYHLTEQPKNYFAMAGLGIGAIGIVREASLPVNVGSFSFAPFIAGVALGAVCVGMLALVRVDGKWKVLDRQAGDLSYPLYLNHHAAILLCSRFLTARSGYVVLAALLVAVGLAWTLSLVLEPALKAVRDHVRGQSLS